MDQPLEAAELPLHLAGVHGPRSREATDQMRARAVGRLLTYLHPHVFSYATMLRQSIEVHHDQGATMSDNPASDWDPRNDSVLRDQRDTYDEMRERCPVAHSDFLDWSLFRHKDIMTVLSDPGTYSSATRHRAIPNGMDEPQHGRYRQALDPFLDVTAMDAFEQRCRTIATDSVQLILARDNVDIVSDFTEPFSLKSLCALIGWPLDSWQQLRGWSHGNQQAAFTRDRKAGKSLAAEFSGYVAVALDARRTSDSAPNADLTSSLMAVRVDVKHLSEEDIVSILRNWTAGHGTVAAGIGIVILYLAKHQDLQHQLREDPARLPAAIDEILRVDGPLVANRRTTTRDVEIGGRMISADQKLTLMWIGANRDESAFEGPNEVRLNREVGENLLFGWGVHNCQGILLARLEMRMALEELLARTSRIELVPTEVPRRDVYPSNGLGTIMVHLD